MHSLSQNRSILSHIVIGLIIFLLCFTNINNGFAQDHVSKTKLCIFISINNDLEKQLIKRRNGILHKDKKSKLIKNNYHISLRHVEYNFTKEEIKEISNNLQQIAEKNYSFSYKTEQQMYIDEDLDVGLNLIMDPLYNQLKYEILHMPIPGKSRTYDPHTTIYYAINEQNRKAIQRYLNLHPFNSTTSYSASKVGIGILGPRNNLIKIIALFDLIQN